MTENRLSVTFFDMPAQSPFVLASGIIDVSYSSMLKAVESECGIVTMKSLTLQPRKGHEGPVVAEFPGGFLNSIGLSNPGIHAGLEEINEFKSLSPAPVIASVFSVNTEEFLQLTAAVNDSRADAIELNLSCPNVSDEYGVPLAASKEKVSEIVSEVKKIARKPVIAKLSPNTYNVPEIALAAEHAGADALTLINTLGPGMVINVHARKPAILNKYGGISGPAIKPIALKLVHEISHLVKVPIIGMGGITTAEDCIEFLLAGACFIGVGTAVYYEGFNVFQKMREGILRYLDNQNLETIHDIKPIA